MDLYFLTGPEPQDWNAWTEECILPLELALAKNCYDPFFMAAAHVLIGLWYKDDAVLEWSVPDGKLIFAATPTERIVHYLCKQSCYPALWLYLSSKRKRGFAKSAMRKDI